MVEDFEWYDDKKTTRARDKLRRFLAKLGVKKAQSELELRLEELQAAIEASKNNFGQPDKIIMNPETFKRFKELLKK